MSVLDRVTIRSRLIASFALMVAFFALFGVFSFDALSRLGGMTAELYEHPLEARGAAHEAAKTVVGMHRDMKDLVLSRSAVELQNAIQSVRSGEEQVYRHLDLVRERILGDEGKGLEREARSLFAAWKPIREEVIELVVKGQRDAGALITRGKGAEQVRALDEKMEALVTHARKSAKEFMKSAEELERLTLRNTVILLFLVVIVSFLVVRFMTSSILSSISSLNATMSKITATGNLQKAKVRGKNEISDMSRHFNLLVDKLAEQLWIRDSRKDLVTELSGGIPPDDLVARGLRLVSRSVDACAGALYLYDEEDSSCRLKSTFASANGNPFPVRFRTGEGVVGQVAVEKKAILLKNIGRGDALITTGTVAEPPKSIYAIPLLHEENLLGVMEVASFEEIGGVKKEFLDAAAQIVSTGLNASCQNDRIRGLLQTARQANEELQAQKEELYAMNEELRQQSEEIRGQNLALAAQRERVEEANRLKSEFLANMSHELRTPLNSVMALSRVLILQGKGRLSEEELNYLAIIERNGKRLLTLINDILDLSKIEAGRMEVNPETFSLASTLDAIVESLEVVAKGKGIQLIQKVPSGLPRIESDESRVNQILQNIIGNAVKFTHHGQVVVSASSDQEEILVRVEDTGIGISQKDLPLIFEEFRQVDGSSARLYEGTGLGLAIAYKAVKILGGDLSVESIVGKGSVFTVSLPVRWQGRSHGFETKPVAVSSAAPEDGKTVLMVDDEPRIPELFSGYLTEAGYKPIPVNSGKEALRLARTHRPFAITLDVIMPEMDGFELLQELKKAPETRDIPVIILSVTEDRKTASALGADSHIQKPTTAEALIQESDTLARRLLDELGKLAPESRSDETKRIGKTVQGDRRILLVEDNDVAVIQVKAALRDEAYVVDVAHSGMEAIETVRRTVPDGIILDLMMPGIDGFEVLEKIRGTSETATIPVLILTAKDLTREDLQRLTENNVQQLVQKGDVDREGLLLKVRMMMGTRAKPNARPSDIIEAGPNAQSKRRGWNRVEGIPTVLVIEDNPDNMATLRAVLKEGYRIVEAKDGESGLESALGLLPDIILLDMSLPGMDGFEVVKSLKMHKEVRDIPVIALTARAMKGDRERIISAGCDDYVSKPIEPGAILEKMAGWLKNNLGEE